MSQRKQRQVAKRRKDDHATALLALGIAGGWYWLRGSLPPLAGELSLGAAISSLEWVSSHEEYGRNR